MGVFLNETIDYSKPIISDSLINENIGNCKVYLDFSSKKVFTTNYKLSKKTHTNKNLHNIVLPNLFEIGSIQYKSENFKVVLPDYNFGGIQQNNIPGANPQFINGEYVILCLHARFYLGLYLCMCIHELGHIITLRNTELEWALKDISRGFKTNNDLYQAGTAEGLADAFMYSQIKDNKKLINLAKTKYYYLFYGKDSTLEKRRNSITFYSEYSNGYKSIIYEDIYSSPKVKEFSK